MTRCVHCRQRKGKRPCPALRGAICPACCGEHRQREIDCPPDCPYLGNEEYQRQRTFDKVPPSWIERLARYERRDPTAQEVLHEVQLAICRHSGRPDHAAVMDGPAFARRRMSPIETPEPFIPPFGELLVERLDALIQAHALVERQGVRDVLDEVLRHLGQDVKPDSFERFVQFLGVLYSDHLAAERRRPSSSLILPG